MPKFLILILLLPAIAAFGHDVYLYYIHTVEPAGTIPFSTLLSDFRTSALGFLWLTYHADSYKEVVRALPKEQWAIIDTILTFKAVHVGLIFAGLMTGIFWILGSFGIGPCKEKAKTLNTKGKKGKSIRAKARK